MALFSSYNYAVRYGNSLFVIFKYHFPPEVTSYLDILIRCIPSKKEYTAKIFKNASCKGG